MPSASVAVIFVTKEIPKHLRIGTSALNDTTVSESVFLYCVACGYIYSQDNHNTSMPQ
jgi:hypothetical protein